MHFFMSQVVVGLDFPGLKVQKLLKRILIIVSALFLLLLISAAIVLRFFEDDAVKYALEKSKTLFKTRVEIGDAELTFWQTFPSASLHLKDVYVEETFESADTLIFARSLFLKFNLLDLFRSRYNIHTVDVDDAKMNMRMNKAGEDNWHFWKSNPEDTGQFSLELKEVSIKKTRLLFDDAPSRFFLDIFSEKSVVKGQFTDSRFDVNLDLKGFLFQVATNGERYGLSKKIELASVLNANTVSGEYAFVDSELDIEKMAFLLSGKIQTGEPTLYEIKLKGDDIDLDDLKASLSETQRRTLLNYDPRGEIDIDMVASRKDKTKPSFLDVHLIMRDGEMEHRESGMSLQNISCDVQYTHFGKTDQLKIRELSSKLGNGYMTVAGSVNSFSRPVLDLQVTADMNLRDIQGFFALDTLERCEGQMKSSATISGELKYSEADSSYDWKALLASGSAQLDQGIVKLKNSNREFSALQGEIAFDRKNVQILSFSGLVNGNDFRITGGLQNFIPFVTSDDEKLFLEAKLNSEFIDFTNMVETNATTSSDNNYAFELPERIDFILNTNVRKFVFRKFQATDVKGVTSLQRGLLTIDPVTFNTADGQFSAQISIARSDADNYGLNCLAKLNNINIKRLFTEFENFGQDFIQDKHLKGIAKATVQFRTELSTSLVLRPDKMESLLDIVIDNGELNDLESLQDIADYIRGNKWVAPFVNEDKFSEKMKNISFSRLENVIEIRDRVITIPLMEIRSSALDIAAKGTHTFDNNIDYAIGFNLRDVLVKKEKEWTEVDDGLGKRMFVSMKGTTDNPLFSMDKELAKEVRQSEMLQEKQNVKALLKEELGLFKKDGGTGAFKETKSEGGSTITVGWGDEVPVKSSNGDNSKTKEKEKEDKSSEPEKKKKVPKWLEEKE
jgi:uncharacterized protein involved in outer membrane biogenesis